MKVIGDFNKSWFFSYARNFQDKFFSASEKKGMEKMQGMERQR